MGLNVGDNQLVLLDEVLHAGQVLAQVLGRQQQLYVRQPELNVLHSVVVLLLLVGLLQLLALVGRVLVELAPQMLERIDARLDDGRVGRRLRHQVLARVHHLEDAVRVGRNLGLERLMLLQLALQIGRILVPAARERRRKKEKKRSRLRITSERVKKK